MAMTFEVIDAAAESGHCTGQRFKAEAYISLYTKGSNMPEFAGLAERRLEMWNATETVRRRQLVEKLFTENATYTDPLGAVTGWDDIDALLAGHSSGSRDCRSGSRARSTATMTPRASGGTSASTAPRNPWSWIRRDRHGR